VTAPRGCTPTSLLSLPFRAGPEEVQRLSLAWQSCLNLVCCVFSPPTFAPMICTQKPPLASTPTRETQIAPPPRAPFSPATAFRAQTGLFFSPPLRSPLHYLITGDFLLPRIRNPHIPSPVSSPCLLLWLDRRGKFEECPFPPFPHLSSYLVHP